MEGPSLRTVHLGRIDYSAALAAMRRHVAERAPGDADELWLCEHPPVYTLGIAGRLEHLHDAGGIPVVRSDRGGQITYHGPGQVIAYPLVDLRRLGIGPKEYVYRLEHCALRLLERLGITGHRVTGAPGVYVRTADPAGHGALRRDVRTGDGGLDRFDGLAKVAALGVKVSRHCAYHGLAVNVAMDLAPFDRIDACGHAGLRTTDLATLGSRISLAAAGTVLSACLAAHLQP